MQRWCTKCKLKLVTDGILLIDKPADMTSFGVVARVRRVLSERAGRKVKVGHTGTLDPFATGLMIIVVGKETKNAMALTKLDKVYEATIVLGQRSTTGDTEGEITQVSDVVPDETAIKAALEGFVGEISQTPPAFSAIKVNGVRAYKLAHKGETVEIPTRQVQVYSLEMLDYSYPDLKIRTHVSSGTYIRTLAEDIGTALGTGAYCRELRRTKIASHSIKQAMTLESLGVTS